MTSGWLGPRLRWHLGRYTRPGDDALVFTSPTGSPLRHNNFRRRFWLPVFTAADMKPVHFHDLRHTGNTLTADAGANLRELMERMGHRRASGTAPRANLVAGHSQGQLNGA